MSATSPVANEDAVLGARRGFLLAGVLLGALAVSEALRPRHLLSASGRQLKLETDIPRSFGGWTIDDSIIPLLPNLDVQEKLNELYSQILARTYVNARQQRVMLSIAYGSDQSSELTSVHRPEFCYRAQGFAVQPIGRQKLQFGSRALVVQQLLATSGQRFEPITYWVTLGTKVVLPGWERRVEQLRYGVRGDIPDGMLVRTSTVGLDEAASLELQRQFLAALDGAVDDDARRRIFGD